MFYEYRPVPDRRPALAAVAALSVAAVGGMMPTVDGFRVPLRQQRAAAALAAVMVAARFLVCRYAYGIAAGEDGAWITVKDLRRERVLSVIGADGGSIEKYTPETRRRLKKAGIAVVNRCVDIFPREAYVFVPKAALDESGDANSAPDERCALKFQPDGTMLDIIQKFFSE